MVACAAAGTDYVDLTDEPEFVDLMWLRHHQTAVASGARIVHSCGFDSIPHDLGVYYTAQQLPARIHYESALHSWVVPMPMPTIDPQVVRRSARALERYGPDFRYAHCMQVKKLFGVAATGGVATLFTSAQLKSTRDWLLARKRSGEGSTVEQRARGRFRVRFHGRTAGIVFDVVENASAA